jgi:predicted nucleic acid-binding protein
MTVVVDASVAIRWLFQLDGTNRAEKLIRSGQPLIAPDLVLAEITNAAWKFVTFDGVPAETAAMVVKAAGNAFDEIVPSSNLTDRALAIALELRHPAYDCFYLALAEKRRCELVSADARLIARCARTPFAKLVRPLAA